jgi:hypothetical protein
MLNFPDAPVIGDIYSGPPSFKWDGVKWMGLPVAESSSLVPSDAPPAMDNVASAGALIEYQRGDHIHPTDTSRAALVSPWVTGMVADSVAASGAYTSNLTTYANSSIVSQNADVDGQPSVGCYNWDRGYVMGLMLDVNNRVAVANMYGDGLPTSNPANIDINGNLYLATTMLVSRDPTGGLDVATLNYVNTRAINGGYMPLSGAQMSGQLYANPSWGSLMGNPAPSIEVRGNNCDAYMTFHRSGYFACNFGMSSDWNFWMGGWSYGAGVAYRFWSTRDFGGLPVTDSRLAFCTDLAHGSYSGLQENWGGAVISGSSGYNGQGLGSYTIVIRYRYLQLLTNGWYTVGYA